MSPFRYSAPASTLIEICALEVLRTLPPTQPHRRLLKLPPCSTSTKAPTLRHKYSLEDNELSVAVSYLLQSAMMTLFINNHLSIGDVWGCHLITTMDVSDSGLSFRAFRKSCIAESLQLTRASSQHLTVRNIAVTTTRRPTPSGPKAGCR